MMGEAGHEDPLNPLSTADSSSLNCTKVERAGRHGGNPKLNQAAGMLRYGLLYNNSDKLASYYVRTHASRW